MGILRYGLCVLILVCVADLSMAGSGSEEGVKSFEEEGIVVDVHAFFEVAQKTEDFQEPEDVTSGRALVSSTGVYAFLETPENAAHLKEVAPGSAVKLTGKLLVSGALLHIEKLEQLKEAPDVKLEAYQKEKGRPVSLTGKNKCQCGLKVASLPHSCKLGHLHHLEASDGKIYHYLQFGDAKNVFLGKGFHSKDVTVKARALPGQYLLVESVDVKELKKKK